MQKMKLNDIADVYSGATFKRYVDREGTLKKVIVQRSIKTGEEITDFDQMKFNDKINGRYLTQKGDILMKTPSPNDVVCVNEEGMVIGDRIAIIRLKEGYDPSFICHLLTNYYVKKQLHKFQTTTVISQVSISDIKQLELIVPSYEKQKEYGELLDSIDEKIKINYQIIESDKELKEGLLNKLIEKGGYNE